MATSSSSPPPTASDQITNSPSELSYSPASAASRTSTRNTSPDSESTPAPSFPSRRRASSLLDLNINVDIEHTPNTLLELQPTMDRNPFQSVNERRNKIVTDRNNNTNNQIQQPQQQQPFQTQTLRSNMPSISLGSLGPAPRGLASSNWRTGDEVAMSARSSGDNFPQFDVASGHHHIQQASSIPQSSYTGGTVMDHYQQQQHSPIASYTNPNTEIHLDATYAYCYDRGNGQYTRLVPVDMLPPLKDIPALQQSCSGMMILPQPRAVPPNGRSSNTEPIMIRVSSYLKSAFNIFILHLFANSVHTGLS